MAERRSFWSKAILESAMIIFSVFSALFINEWNKGKNEAEKTVLIMQNVKSEIETNKKMLEEAISYHEEVMARLIQSSEDGTAEKQTLEDNFFNVLREIAPRGFYLGQLQNIAWTVAKEDKITNRISLEESQILFGVYKQQELVEKSIWALLDFLSSREMHKKELVDENLIILQMLMNEMLGREKVLEAKCTNALDMIQQNEE
ncbi:MAG: hypothetical protein HRT61_19675 [Ekhidna sp.]|nr:hypothetical protein [Ekhidna sp.]